MVEGSPLDALLALKYHAPTMSRDTRNGSTSNPFDLTKPMTRLREQTSDGYTSGVEYISCVAENMYNNLLSNERERGST